MSLNSCKNLTRKLYISREVLKLRVVLGASASVPDSGLLDTRVAKVSLAGVTLIINHLHVSASGRCAISLSQTSCEGCRGF